MTQTHEIVATITTPGHEDGGLGSVHVAVNELIAVHIPPTDTPELTGETQQRIDEAVSGPEIANHVKGGITDLEYLDEHSGYRKQEMIDDGGQGRPIYTINGHKIAMRTRWDFPSYEGLRTAIVGNTEDPTQMVEDGAVIEDEQGWHRRYESFLASQIDTEQADVVFVPNTPVGVIEATFLLTGEQDEGLMRLRSEIEAGIYTDRAFALIDQIIGTMSMGDDGEFLDYIDNDAFPLVIAALSGVSEAQDIVKKRMTNYEIKRKLVSQSEDEERRRWFEAFGADIEAVPAYEVCLVHSTAYEIEKDKNGNIVLYSAAQKRRDRFPRATVHFTPNSQVTSHPEGVWGDKNRLIVTNMKDMIDANGVPLQMSDVDTSFALNPGEHLVLPNAVIVEPSSDQQDLIMEHDGVVTYKLLADEQYTEEEKAIVREMIRQYPGYIPPDVQKSTAACLRECVLRRVMSKKGAKIFNHAGMHYGSNESFQRAYGRLADQLNVETALHANTQERQLEHDAAYTFDVGGVGRKEMYVYRSASIQSLRQYVASGYVPVAKRLRTSRTEVEGDEDLEF